MSPVCSKWPSEITAPFDETRASRKPLDRIAPVLVAGDCASHPFVHLGQASIDPLERALLLLELSPDKTPPASALAAARDLVATPLPYGVFRIQNPIAFARFAADGSLFAADTADTVSIWKAGANLASAPVTVADRAVAAAYDPESNSVLTIGADRRIRLWDVGTGKAEILGENTGYQQAGFIDRVPALASTRELSTWQRDGGLKTILQLPAALESLQFSANNRLFVVAGRFSPTGAMGPSTGNKLGLAAWALPGRSDAIGIFEGDTRVSCSAGVPRGEYVSVITDTSIAVYASDLSERRVATLRSASTQRRPSSTSVLNLGALSPDAQLLAVGFLDGTATLLPLTKKDVSLDPPAATNTPDPSRFSGRRGLIVDIACSPTGEYFATAGADRTIRLWRTPKTGKEIPPPSTVWSELWKEIRSQTSACLTRADRMRLLGETLDEAASRQVACESAYSRTLPTGIKPGPNQTGSAR